MKTYITYFDDNQIKEFGLKSSEDTILFKGNDTSVQGDSINHLNAFYCELTTMYWVWKNTDDKLLCFKQYRRPFNTNIIPNEKEIVTYEPIRLFNTIYDQFSFCHGNSRAREVAKVLINDPSIDSMYYEYFMYGKIIYTNNTMVINRTDFDKMCEFVFGILFRLDNIWNLNFDVKKYEANSRIYVEDNRIDYQRHFMAYIGERLVSMFITKNLVPITVKRLENNGFYSPYKQNA